MIKLRIDKEELKRELSSGKTRQEVAEVFGVKIWTIESRIKEYSLQGLSGVKYELMTLENPVFCYLLGWFVTDGYLTKGNRVSIRIREEQPMKILSEYFGARYYDLVNNDTHEMYFAWAPAIFRRSFKDSKTFTVRAPKLQTREQILMFMRGVIEGDGSIRQPGKHPSDLIRIFTASKLFAKDIQSLLQQISVQSRMRQDRMGWEITITSREFLQELYSIHREYVLQRKLERAQGWAKYKI